MEVREEGMEVQEEIVGPVYMVEKHVGGYITSYWYHFFSFIFGYFLLYQLPTIMVLQNESMIILG